MTISNSVKAQLFAMHLNQKVFCHDRLPDNPYMLQTSDIGTDALINNGYLQLRSISNLTDFECLKIAKLVYGNTWNDKEFFGIIIPNAENVHDDIISVGIQRFISHPLAAKWYKDAHIQIDRVDADVNKLAFRNDGTEQYDEIIDSVNLWAIQDYLRSIGILLPFTYLDNNQPITLTTSQLEQFGWVKIKN